MIFVTGGAGFVGSNFVTKWLQQINEPLVNVDKLTYAGNLNSLLYARACPSHIFIHADICDTDQMLLLMNLHKPRAIVHFAAESHVDRSIYSPAKFIRTNINGTFSLLEAACAYWTKIPTEEKNNFRFLHISTDEVYGSLQMNDTPFSEVSPYAPNNPYAASKAASDHLVRSFHRTHGLPTLTTNCSNNYGPYQFPEKLIPFMLGNALAGNGLPIYGDGLHIRDWLHVNDHCGAIIRVLESGKPGETYNIGGCNEKTNLQIVHTLCDLLDVMKPLVSGTSYREQITHVADRPGHDRRYAIDARKIERELGWRPAETFETGIEKTVEWYLGNQAWIHDIQSGAYMSEFGKN